MNMRNEEEGGGRTKSTEGTIQGEERGKKKFQTIINTSYNLIINTYLYDPLLHGLLPDLLLQPHRLLPVRVLYSLVNHITYHFNHFNHYNM